MFFFVLFMLKCIRRSLLPVLGHVLSSSSSPSDPLSDDDDNCAGHPPALVMAVVKLLPPLLSGLSSRISLGVADAEQDTGSPVRPLKRNSSSKDPPSPNYIAADINTMVSQLYEILVSWLHVNLSSNLVENQGSNEAEEKFMYLSISIRVSTILMVCPILRSLLLAVDLLPPSKKQRIVAEKQQEGMKRRQPVNESIHKLTGSWAVLLTHGNKDICNQVYPIVKNIYQ